MSRGKYGRAGWATVVASCQLGHDCIKWHNVVYIGGRRGGKKYQHKIEALGDQCVLATSTRPSLNASCSGVKDNTVTICVDGEAKALFELASTSLPSLSALPVPSFFPWL